MGGMEAMPSSLPDLISSDPDPMQQGQPAKVCFDFRPGDPDTIPLIVTWTVEEGTLQETCTLKRNDPCHTIDVPADAVAVNIEDTTATSADYGGVVY